MLCSCVILLGVLSLAHAGYQGINFYTSTFGQITEFAMTMSVPPLPTQNAGTLFIWPGLEPLSGSANFNPINLGVLQPVLTYGPSCAPNQPSDVSSKPYSSWWISGQYVNTYGQVSGYTGCNGGDVMKVFPGDLLFVNMSLSGRVWTQTVTSRSTGQRVAYSIDMRGQAQNWAMLVFENYGSFTPSPAWSLTDIVIETSVYDANLCTSSSMTFPSDGRASCSGISRYGTSCYIASCDFKAGYPLPAGSSLHTMFKAKALTDLSQVVM
eukprot:TRINITY_DN12_c0_g2_i1.p1 TRINITY_DN12_c0_g2~~TRINITY_DN12_c0_g2_i1.p1  ORF type:complete len:267 (+),score=48.13 TRINITY_DN12_c0_g2_i1:76-876(+)